GVSFFDSLSARLIASEASRLYFATIARASQRVVGSGTVGPEPIAEGSSPGTSEIAMVVSFAGRACRASRPPLMRDRCLRTVLISVTAARERGRAGLFVCLP